MVEVMALKNHYEGRLLRVKKGTVKEVDIVGGKFSFPFTYHKGELQNCEVNEDWKVLD